MLRQKVSQVLGEKKKLAIKTRYSKTKKLVVDSLLSYDGNKLKTKLRKMGVSESDSLMVHANFKPDSGFKGTPVDVVNALIDLVGKKGNLLMVSIPYRGRAYDYLMKKKPFRLKKTMSMMGLITEVFRRKEGVLRSFHPTHPVLVYGKDSVRLVADHEKCLFPCGVGSPFDKFRQMNGKILFYDVSFRAITFFHYVEDLTKDELPFNPYTAEPFVVTGFDQDNQEREIKTYVYNPNVVTSARKLEEEMLRRDLIKKGKVGNSNLILATAEDVVTCQTSMVDSGNFPYESW